MQESLTVLDRNFRERFDRIEIDEICFFEYNILLLPQTVMAGNRCMSCKKVRRGADPVKTGRQGKATHESYADTLLFT